MSRFASLAATRPLAPVHRGVGAVALGRVIRAAALVLVVTTGCGGGGGPSSGPDASPAGACGAVVASCKTLDTGACEDYMAPYDPSIVTGVCTGDNAQASTSACDHTGAVAGCLIPPGTQNSQVGCRTDWFFPPLTKDQLASACAGLGGTLVDP